MYWTLIHFVGQIFPYMFWSYYTNITLEVFIPVVGRSGPSLNPDSIIAITSICFGIFMGGYIIPTFGLFKRPLIVISGLIVVFISFIIIIATPVGFPFKSESPQRYWIFVGLTDFFVNRRTSKYILFKDTQRTFHNLDGSIRKEDNGYFMLSMDRHMNDYVMGNFNIFCLAFTLSHIEIL